MKRNNLLIAGVLIGCFIILSFVIGAVVFILLDEGPFIDDSFGTVTFDNSTPKATAISIARLNLGTWGFDYDIIKSVNLTSDGKYWIVEIYTDAYKDEFSVVTINAKTWASKIDNEEWKSLDKLKARYVAEIQIYNEGDIGKPHEISMDGKKIWKLPVYFTDYDENGSEYITQTEYIYVDVATGKSKSTWDKFNKFAGTDGWLTLKQVDDVINRRGFPGPTPFKNALGDLYPE